MTAHHYLDAIRNRLDALENEQLPGIERAGQIVADAIGSGHRVWLTQTSHALHDEVTRRAGGLMAAHVLHDPITIAPGDVVLAGTNAGTAAPYIEIAREARTRGATVIVLTQLNFERQPDLVLGHPRGQRLHELADLVIDLGGEIGDGELPFGDSGVQILPSSGVTGIVALWMIFGEAVARLTAQGKPPLMWQAIQLPGAVARNAALQEEYLRTGLGYAAD